MQRRVRPEMLDSLPPGHPDAQHNRRDLRLFNALMGNHRWLARVLRRHVRAGDRVLELGAGEGDLGRRLRPHWAGLPVAYAGLDLWPRPADWPETWGWFQSDLRSFAHYENYNVIIGNFILHQFEDPALRALAERWRAHARMLVFCETARGRLHLAQLPFARLLGINRVSRHDARVSIEGGFRGRELAELLGVNAMPWRTASSGTFLGAHRMIALREKS